MLLKRKHPDPDAQTQTDDCARELRAFLRGGLAGWDALSRCHHGIRTRYHGDDMGGWAASCRQAFMGYPCAETLEQEGWSLISLATVMYECHPVDEVVINEPAGPAGTS